MDFAAQNQIITVDQRIDKGFKNASLTVIGHFNTGVGGFLPTSFHVPLYEAHTFIEQNDQAAGILCAVESIHHTAAFIKTVPTGTEQTGVLNRSIVRK